MGNRGKDGQLATYLDIVSRRRKRCSVAAVGNEANARHHFLGKIQPDMEYESVEVSVEENMPGFFIEMWANAPELYAVSVSSPTGETSLFIYVFQTQRRGSGRSTCIRRAL